MFFAVLVPTFCNHVSDIRGVVAKKKMQKFYACPVITGMQNPHG